MLKKILSAAIILFFGVWVTRYVLLHHEDFRRLAHIGLIHVVLLALINIVLLFNNGYFLKECLTAFCVRISFLEYFSISNFSTFLNYVVPFRGGLGFRALYLKKKHGLDFGKFATIIAGTVVVYAFIISVLGLLCVVIVWVRFNLLDYISLIGFLILCACLSCAVFFPLTAYLTKHQWLNKILQVVTDWDCMRKDRRLLRRLSLVALNNSVFAALLSWVAFDAIGRDLDFFIVLYITTVSGLAALIGITPGAIGILEATMLFIGNQLGVSSSDILMVALINRASAVIVTAALVPFTTYILSGATRWKLPGKDDD